MQGRWKRRLLLATGGMLTAGEAAAGAWSHAAGEGLQIATVSKETGEFGDGWRADILFESGLGGGWDVTLKTQSLVRTNFTYDERSTYEAGVRKSFVLGPGSVAAVQASVLGGESLTGPACEGTGYEARAHYGVSRALGSGSVFADLGAAVRERGADCRRTLVDLTVGVDVGPTWQALGKVWSERGDGAESAKVEALLLRDFGDYDLGLGYRREISGQFEEEAILVSYWARF
jgi:hypothetical protein